MLCSWKVGWEYVVWGSLMTLSQPLIYATQHGLWLQLHTRASNLMGMDAISGLLSGPRAREAFVLRCELDGAWALRVQDEAPLTLMAVLRGSAYVTATGAEPVHLGPGDVALARGPAPYDVASTPGLQPSVVIHPGQRCTTLDGTDLRDVFHRGVRTWGTTESGSTSILVGTYTRAGEVGRRTLAALPELLVLDSADWHSPLLDHLADELASDEPGQSAVLDRLLDLLVIGVLRAWFARAEAPPGWYAARGDRVVGAALRLIHDDVARPWSLAALASAASVSRATLARRFADLVGQTPMAYLTEWRLALAADLLADPDLTLAEVARRVGYATPFALSAAFKRQYGVSPKQHRLEQATA
jgi:AraC-like DNA-binding protein